jgi:DNA polymerase III subunit delta'
MKDLLIHPATHQHLVRLTKSPPQVVLLAGPAGSGKHTLAHRFIETVLELPKGGLNSYPYHMGVAAADASIGIGSVRELERFLALKVPRQSHYNRSILIEDAQLLSTEAQNALLKTLEEPPDGTLIILAANRSKSLLPTVRSRAQSISVRRPDRTSTEAYFQAMGFKPADVSRAYVMSGGQPGLIRALLEQSDHPLKHAAQRARALLSQPAYERLLAVDELAKQRALTQDILFIIWQMAQVSLQTASDSAAAKWRDILMASYKAAEALDSNAQPKVVLTNLMLNL